MCHITETGPSGAWKYSDVLGAGQETNWHHYAVVWKHDGIPGVSDGTKKVATYLNGQINSVKWTDYRTTGFPGFLGSPVFSLIATTSSPKYADAAAIDNLKVWNYAKTDFSDWRSVSSVVLAATTALLWEGAETGSGGSGSAGDGDGKIIWGKIILDWDARVLLGREDWRVTSLRAVLATAGREYPASPFGPRQVCKSTGGRWPYSYTDFYTLFLQVIEDEGGNVGGNGFDV